VRYEWDGAKASTNRRKHDVSFFDAIAALEDPNRLEDFDEHAASGEERARVIGMLKAIFCS
jgi:uncharacterized DUF497 family protein